MALQSQVVPVLFRGVDTKRDQRGLVPGDLTVSKNLRYDAYPKLLKRYGSEPVANFGTGALITTFKDQLFIASGSDAYALTAANVGINKGILETMQISTISVARSNYTQRCVDGAVHSDGISVFAYEVKEEGVWKLRYSVYCTATGQPIVSNQLISTTGAKPKVLAFGNAVVILYWEVGNTLRYVRVPSAAPQQLVGPTTLAVSAFDVFDAAVLERNILRVAYVNSSTSTIYTNFISTSYVAGAPDSLLATATRPTALAFFIDSFGDYWVSWAEGVSPTNVYVQSFTSRLIPYFVSPRLVEGVMSGQTWNITMTSATYGVAILYEFNQPRSEAGNLGFSETESTRAVDESTLAIQTTSGFGYLYGEAVSAIDGQNCSSLTVDDTLTPATTQGFIRKSEIVGNRFATIGRLGNSVLSRSTFARGVGLASKAFVHHGRTHALVAYESLYGTGVQNTYFLVSDGTVVGKVAVGLGDGLTRKTGLPEVTSTQTGVYVIPYLQTERITSGGVDTLGIVSQVGSQAATFDFNGKVSAQELSDNLHISGGILWMYDGAQVCEHNFNVYPEITTVVGFGTGNITGTYAFCAVYEWMDNHGCIHQSAPSPVQNLTVSGVQGFSWGVSTLRLTSKSGPVSIVLYRTTANQSVMYRVTTFDDALINNTAVDSLQKINDTVPDVILLGRQQLYSNPLNPLAEVPALASSAPAYITRYRNRAVVIPAENPYIWLFSKSVGVGVPTNLPVEFNPQQFFQPIEQEGGPLVAAVEMDEKLVFFKRDKIYFITGDGPAPNGTGNDYPNAYHVPTDCGCVSVRSLVLTPKGIMFQSAKGIYLLGRDMQVSYIGDNVESYNADRVTSAELAPGNRRVLFTLDSGVVLSYDYLVDMWSVWDNLPAVDSTVYNSLYYRLDSGGLVHKETPNHYTDNGIPVMVSLATSWLSFAGLSGFQRVWRMILKGDYRGAHQLNVLVHVDDNPGPAQMETVVPSDFVPEVLFGVGIFGTDSPFGGAFYPYEWQVKLRQQKCTSMKVEISEKQAGPVFTEGLALSGITFLVGVEKGMSKVPALRSI